MSLITFSWSRMRPAFYRRYKWAFLREYDIIDTPAVGHPDMLGLAQACSQALQVILFMYFANVRSFISVLARMNTFRLLG
jgi:hypothetical protein